MCKSVAVNPPRDQAAREQALDAHRSVLVEAPAGSGKTDLLTRRFLRLLAEVDDPAEMVAITFTIAAAAEMRQRILAELEKAAGGEDAEEGGDPLSMEALAARALARSRQRGWNLIDLPGQLRITTIDAFCRELAVRQPLLSGLGGGLDIAGDPQELYRRAARRTIEEIDTAGPELRAALETLLLWRDNNWQEMESLLSGMLAKRDRWMQEFLFASHLDWDALRGRLERPFARAVRSRIEELSARLARAPGACEQVLELARFACEQPGRNSPVELAQCTRIPSGPFGGDVDSARSIFARVAEFLLTKTGKWRSPKGLTVAEGFPPTERGRAGKQRFGALAASLGQIGGLESALAAVKDLPGAHYTDEEWRIVRACFVLLRRSAAHLEVAFAEAGAVDFTKVAQIALKALGGFDGNPSDTALAASEQVRHLLVDEFQDTSRRQHQLLGHLIAAWPEREGRTCFVVGDPMQSIYFFRDADAELFPRTRDKGLEIPGDRPLCFDRARLEMNFRTRAPLVRKTNEFFSSVFASGDGSGVGFTAAVAIESHEAADEEIEPRARFQLHLGFMPRAPQGRAVGIAAQEARKRIQEERNAARNEQVGEIVELIRGYSGRIEAARAEGKKFRIAVLARTHAALTPVAAALREAEVPFRAIELEKLNRQPEVMDALMIVRALANPHDRIAWLGLLRAPWSGLSLADLHTLAAGDGPAPDARPIRELIAERAGRLSPAGQTAARRVLAAISAAEAWRAARPASALGSWIEAAWLRLGGAACVDAAERANVDLLWRALDSLPETEADAAGPALEAALQQLKALPDPGASSEHGVQLMTIHKAKGLEFEVVIVPEMHGSGGRKDRELLAWFERGLSAGDGNEATEFLVAPIPTKGADRGRTKLWVDSEYSKRERQEMRRILYVAVTRAREGVHLFARPEYAAEKDGSLKLAEPRASLLATAWPAVQEEAERRFAEWAAARAAEPGEVADLAASAGRLVEMRAAKPAVLRRLPAAPAAIPRQSEAKVLVEPAATGEGLEYNRHQGGWRSRALGVAVHSAFEALAALVATRDWNDAAAALSGLKPRWIADVRALGFDASAAAHVAAQAIDVVRSASLDPVARWILAPRPTAASEQCWAGAHDGRVHTVRVDRIFRAGLEPGSEGDVAWWIVDYKTAHTEEADPQTALLQLRPLFAPQLETYARVLRGVHGAGATVHAGLYYPRMQAFDWWKL